MWAEQPQSSIISSWGPSTRGAWEFPTAVDGVSLRLGVRGVVVIIRAKATSVVKEPSRAEAVVEAEAEAMVEAGAEEAIARLALTFLLTAPSWLIPLRLASACFLQVRSM